MWYFASIRLHLMSWLYPYAREYENCGRYRFRRLVGVAYSRNNLAVRTGLRNLNLKSQFSVFDSFQDIRVHICDFLKFVGVKGGVANFYFGSIERY